jgi:hypothetical protein
MKPPGLRTKLAGSAKRSSTFDRGDRDAGRDLTDDRQGDDPGRLRRGPSGGVQVARDEGAGLRRVAAQEAALLERLEVRLDRRRRREPDAFADLPDRRRVPALGRELANDVENALLAVGRGSLGHPSSFQAALAKVPSIRHLGGAP